MPDILKRQGKQILRALNARHILPFLVLLLCLTVSMMLGRDAQRTSEKFLQDEFVFRARDVTEQIQRRMLLYQQALRGGQGLFVASDEVSRESFHKYVDALALMQNFPGIEGIGFAQAVPAAARDAHVRGVRRSGFPQYDILPSGEREFYSPIVYLEPFAGRNLLAFGFDMYSEERRRAAMAQARDGNQAVMSRKTTLVQEGAAAHVQAGFLIYLPVYRNGAPHETIAERRENLLGWVYAPFRMDDLMRGIEGVRIGLLDVEIFDGENPDRADLMYDGDKTFQGLERAGKFRHVQWLDIAGRQWLIIVSSLPAYEEQQYGADRAGLILRGGISISLLLGLLTWVFLDDRARALQAADQAMRLALYDALTGLPNRKLMQERLTQAIAKARRDHDMVALLFIDLDKFKPVNDEYGHAIGDLLLKDVAERLHHCMRASDTVARIGGDEFVALLTQADGKRGAGIAADKILHALTQPFDVSGHRLEIAASIGVALYPEHGEDLNTLLKSADMAMYAAKNSGRSTIRFAASRGE